VGSTFRPPFVHFPVRSSTFRPAPIHLPTVETPPSEIADTRQVKRLRALFGR